jgi:hypothetical protein
MTEKYFDEDEDSDIYHCAFCNYECDFETQPPLFDGMGGRFCSMECMRKGNKTLEVYK